MTPIVTAAPTLNALSNVTKCGGTGGTIPLAGITDGNSGSALPITVTATSSNTAMIPNPTITYTSPNTTGTLAYTITGTPTGTATISVAVTNSGSTFCSGATTRVRTFTVTVNQPSTPTLDPISNQTVNPLVTNPLVINLSGITAGTGTAGHLAVTANTSSSGAVASVHPSYTNPATTGTVSIAFTGFADVVTLSVTVTDGNPANCGSSNTVTRTCVLTIT